MNTISTIEIINSPNAILHKFGLDLFTNLEYYISSNTKIQLSFAGVHNITSGFMNASFGNLYCKYGEKVDSYIVLTDFQNSDWEMKLQDAKELALEPSKAKILNEAIIGLFD